jgi:hypothetical protein
VTWGTALEVTLTLTGLGLFVLLMFLIHDWIRAKR